jgi:hypothetical protein
MKPNLVPKLSLGTRVVGFHPVRVKPGIIGGSLLVSVCFYFQYSQRPTRDSHDMRHEKRYETIRSIRVVVNSTMALSRIQTDK